MIKKRENKTKQPPVLARYGPDVKYGYGVPSAGFCISVFALVREQSGKMKLREGKRSNNNAKELLLFKPKKHRNWLRDWTNFQVFRDQFPDEYDRTFKCWMFPCLFLYEGEHPDQALDRLLRRQLKLRGGQFRVQYPAKLEVFHDKSDWYPGRRHWDFCFVYDVTVIEGFPPKELEKLPWIGQARFVDPKFEGMKRASFAAEYGDVSARLALI